MPLSPSRVTRFTNGCLVEGHDGAGVERARTYGGRLILLDLGVDTSTDADEFVANTIANSAQYERRLDGTRTREGLAAKRAGSR